MKAYSTHRTFWKRLYLFIENVQVNDPMSEEEKKVIIDVCKQKLNIDK